MTPHGVTHDAIIELGAGELKTYDNFLDEVFNFTGGGAVTFRSADPSHRFIISAEVWTDGRPLRHVRSRRSNSPAPTRPRSPPASPSARARAPTSAASISPTPRTASPPRSSTPPAPDPRNRHAQSRRKRLGPDRRSPRSSATATYDSARPTPPSATPSSSTTPPTTDASSPPPSSGRNRSMERRRTPALHSEEHALYEPIQPHRSNRQ